MIKTRKDQLQNELPCSVTAEISSPDNWVERLRKLKEFGQKSMKKRVIVIPTKEII